MKTQMIALISSAVALAGCTGTVQSTGVDQSKLVVQRNADGTFKEWTVDGVVTYPPALFLEKAYLTTGEGANKKPLYFNAPNLTDRCRKTPQFKFAIYPDYSKPTIISYKPGLLETNTFGVAMAGGNGVLTGVNSSSTPDRGQTLTNFASAFGDILGAFKPAIAPPPGGIQACTASPVVVGVVPYKVGDEIDIPVEK